MCRALISLVLVFSLMLAPVVHAAEMTCAKAEGLSVEHESAPKKSSDSKTGTAAHHCSQHVADRTAFSTGVDLSTAPLPFGVSDQDDLPSLVVGPLLEPPAHA